MSSSSNAGGDRPASRVDDSKGPAKPDLYFGDRRKLEDWFNQLEMYFLFNNTATQAKGVFAASFLRGRAQHYVKPLLTLYLEDRTDKEGIFGNFKKFKEYMRDVFGTTNEKNAAVRVIQSLRQKTSAAEYTAQFREYANLTDWKGSALLTMYRRGLKENVKDELMRTGADTSTFENLATAAIEIDDQLYERAMEKRHVMGGRTYALPGRSGGGGRGDPMEIDNIQRGRNKKRIGRGKGNKKTGNMKCWTCDKPGHMSKDCRSKGKVPRKQFNVMTKVLSKKDLDEMERVQDARDKVQDKREEVLKTNPWTTKASRQACLLGKKDECLRIMAENLKKRTDPVNRRNGIDGDFNPTNHATMSWTACYDDYCRVHLSEKQGSGWYPTRPRGQLNMMIRKPLAQRSDQGNQRPLKRTLHREDATLQENCDPDTHMGTEIQDNRPTTVAPSDLVTVPEDDVMSHNPDTPETPKESEEEESEPEHDEYLDPEVYTFTIEGPIQVYKMFTYLAQRGKDMFPEQGGRRRLEPHVFQASFEGLRAMFWDHPLVEVRYDFARFVTEQPPIGSHFNPDGSYTLPNGFVVERGMRKQVMFLKGRYRQMQDEQNKRLRQIKRRQQTGDYGDSSLDESEKDEAPTTEAVNGSSTKY
jgi:hypothetical protein